MTDITTKKKKKSINCVRYFYNTSILCFTSEPHCLFQCCTTYFTTYFRTVKHYLFVITMNLLLSCLPLSHVLYLELSAALHREFQRICEIQLYIVISFLKA